jgi:hypothetical protein
MIFQFMELTGVFLLGLVSLCLFYSAYLMAKATGEPSLSFHVPPPCSSTRGLTCSMEHLASERIEQGVV